jgi:hypothetical protein
LSPSYRLGIKINTDWAQLGVTVGVTVGVGVDVAVLVGVTAKFWQSITTPSMKLPPSSQVVLLNTSLLWVSLALNT